VEDAERLARVIEAFGRNPFTLATGDALAAHEALGQLDVPRALSSLLEQGDTPAAERLLLAAGHAEALRHGPDKSQVLTERVLPRRLVPRLPHKRGAYLRVLLAAARAEGRLRALRGTSDAMQRLRADVWSACFGRSLRHAFHLERVIRDDDVLVFGETGTGKELVAEAIASAAPGGSDGGPAPSASINAAALPDTLVESELFGHVKGAFTGATDTRIGRIRSADGGVFFLDEVGDLPRQTQVKLLRVLEKDEVSPVGSDTTHMAEVRFVAATHRDLERMVNDDEFRRDLYQRLAGNVITLPPLRERPEDVVEIGTAFIEEHASAEGLEEERGRIERWLRSGEAQSYGWPGNVRELQNALRNLLLGLPPRTTRAASRSAGHATSLPPFIEACTASEQEVADWYLDRVLHHTEHNLAQTARILGVDRSTVRRRRKRRSGSTSAES
jgi:DNA-binding NtrC family response regulator